MKEDDKILGSGLAPEEVAQAIIKEGGVEVRLKLPGEERESVGILRDGEIIAGEGFLAEVEFDEKKEKLKVVRILRF